MVARLVHRLATASIDSLIFDPTGTGDSPGEFSDSSWKTWTADTVAAASYLREQGADELIAVALRSGGLLAMSARSELHQLGLKGLVLWQPLPSGQTMLNQFLRLRLAARLDDAQPRESGGRLRERLTAGEVVEVGGYGLTAALTRDMEQVDLLTTEIDTSVSVAWVELVPEAGRELLPASRKIVDRWRQRGLEVQTKTLVGPQFWSTAELVDVPELIDWSADTIRSIVRSSRP